jgi:ABC-type multidrug transport system fused ATPase/permease subunit
MYMYLYIVYYIVVVIIYTYVYVYVYPLNFEYTIVWEDLIYTVPLENKGKKVLLHNINGYCAPGTMTALMGSSGAGKTTLMDVICGRKTSGELEGQILINGVPKNDLTFGKIAGYVEQTDLHMPYYTVHESLMFSAALRLASTVSYEEREKFVKQIEELLELTPILSRIIGNPIVGGLAPGKHEHSHSHSKLNLTRFFDVFVEWIPFRHEMFYCIIPQLIRLM